MRIAASPVTVLPDSQSMTAGQSAWFSAIVSGGGAVEWSISPALGTVTNGYYTAPSVITVPKTVVLTATSLSHSNQTGSSVISLMPGSGSSGGGGGGQPTSASLFVMPSSASLGPAQTMSFVATVGGVSNTGVIWSVAPAVGTVLNGVYTAPSKINSSQTVILTATSLADPSQTGSAAISLIPSGSPKGGVNITVSPGYNTFQAGQGGWFSAIVTGNRDIAVNWSLSPALGTIRNGYYLAPANIMTSQMVLLTATSTADSSKSASATIQLVGSGGGLPTGSGPAPSPVSVQIAPTSVSLMPGQSSQFSVAPVGGVIPQVWWSLVPAFGSVNNGLYTAPSTVTSQTNVTLIATSAVDPTKTASASISVQASPPPVPVSISVSPSSIWVTHGQSGQFTAAVNGSSNTGVLWSIAPAFGSISNGVYTAPSTVTTQQTVTVTATSMADNSKSASATVTVAPVSITLVPASITLAAGQSSQFTATVSGSLNTGVSWSMSTAVGSMVNGLYTAPATVSLAQTITLTATSLADPTQMAHATISLTATSSGSLSVSPAQTSLSASQTQQFSATVTGGIGGSGPTSATWSISPAVGSITQTGFYTAPSSISIQQTIVVTAISSVGNASANVTLTPQTAGPPPPAPPPPSQTTTIQLPLEVMGAGGTTLPVSFNVLSGANLSGQLQLWLQIHGLKYQTEASVQVNGGTWIPINDSTVSLQGTAATFGGIGGGFATLKLTVNLPSGSITTGSNTLTFRFNGTDGATSGFRVLNLNVLAAGGSQLIPQSSFTWDNPALWQPPLNTAADIQAGQNLWNNANLTTAAGVPILAKCSNCHAQDGRDLKYFNYSNYSIRVRSMFHGLSAQQGDQIASYIRTLNVPAPASARPWNPPYQPGPGMDSRPVSDWASGAGIDAVLDDDSQVLPYLMPNGSTANWAHNAYLNTREIPIPFQLADWNHWLPTTHPMDGFGAAFTSSTLAALYPKIRSELRPNDPVAYTNAASDLGYWAVRDMELEIPIIPPETDPRWQNPAFTDAAYSIRLWSLVKQWELNQEFGLEGMSQVVFGPQGASRAWLSQMPFITFNVPMTAAGVGNGQRITKTVDRYKWYHLQLVLNDGKGGAQGTWPIDWAYSLGFPSNDLTWDSQNSVSRFADGDLLILWLVKGLQAKDRFDVSNGWSVFDTDPGQMVGFPAVASAWNDMTSTTRLQLMNGYLQVWLNKIQTFTPQEWYVSGYANQTVLINQTGSQFTTRIAQALPRFRFEGVDPTLVNQLTSLAQTNWPGYNWSGALNAPCVLSSIGEIQCTIP